MNRSIINWNWKQPSDIFSGISIETAYQTVHASLIIINLEQAKNGQHSFDVSFSHTIISSAFFSAHIQFFADACQWIGSVKFDWLSRAEWYRHKKANGSTNHSQRTNFGQQTNQTISFVRYEIAHWLELKCKLSIEKQHHLETMKTTNKNTRTDGPTDRQTNKQTRACVAIEMYIHLSIRSGSIRPNQIELMSQRFFFVWRLFLSLYPIWSNFFHKLLPKKNK